MTPANSAATVETTTYDPSQAVDAVSDGIASLTAENEELKREVARLRKRDDWIQTYLSSMDEELRLARRLQQDFLPKSLTGTGPLKFESIFRPAGYVSGDLYHIARLDEGHVGFWVADAVGHGMPAALLTMFMKNALI